MEKELRYMPVEVRATKTGNKMRVSGVAARYNMLSKPLPAGNTGKTFRERIAKRAFDGVLADKNLDCILSVNHDPDKILGRTASGTLRLRGTDDGLCFDCDLPDTQLGRDTYELVKRKDYASCSFAFELGERDQSWEEEEEAEDEKELGLRGRVAKAIRKIAVRTIKSFRKLHDVSIVTSPAYPGTNVDARNLVAAECRSHVEALAAPKLPRWGVYDGSALDEELRVERRKRMLDAVLD